MVYGWGSRPFSRSEILRLTWAMTFTILKETYLSKEGGVGFKPDSDCLFAAGVLTGGCNGLSKLPSFLAAVPLSSVDSKRKKSCGDIIHCNSHWA